MNLALVVLGLLVVVEWLYDTEHRKMAVRVHAGFAAPRFNGAVGGWATPETFRATVETVVRSHVKHFCEVHRKAREAVTPRGQPVSPDAR